MANIPDTPITRQETYLDAIANGTTEVPEPITREEQYLAWIALNGGGGGGGGEVTGVKGSAESTFRKGNVSISPANIGLGNVNNTSDSSKPVSAPQQAALNLKVDKVDGKGLSTEDYTAEEKTKLEGLENYDDTALSGRVGDIEAVIPSGASTSDKLAKSSDIPDVSGFVTNTVNNLVNYYLKSETYTQAEVDALISAIITLNIEVVQSLPTTDISRTTIYLVPNADPQTSNVKDEYINLDGTTAGWELIGSTAIDLTGYVTDAELTTALADYTTTADLTTLLAAKQDKNLSSAISVDGTPQSTVEGALSAINALAGANKTAIGNIKDGQSIDSFGDVETALADKADKVSGATNGNFAGLDSNGSLTDSGKKASDFSTPSDVQDVYEVMGKNGAKNLIEYPYMDTTKTTSGITYTDNYDGTITANGTPEDVSTFRLWHQMNKPLYLDAGNYILSDGLADHTGTCIDLYNNVGETGTRIARTADGTAARFTLTERTPVGIYLRVYNNVTVSNIVFKPMVRLAEDTDNTYVPYAMTNRELTEFAINKMGRQLPLVNLGTEYTAELKADISSGKFEKAVVGGYLTINGHVYYLAHPDYWLHTGDTECTTHHMLVIPADNIGTGKMNDTNITTGGYAGSDMKTGNNDNTALATAAAQIKADFGASNILTHRELFTTAVTDGKASSWAWADSDVDIMSEVMVYGCHVWETHFGYETGIDKCQLKLFQERPDLIATRSGWWIRGVVSESAFACVNSSGGANKGSASSALSVRPAFAIC